MVEINCGKYFQPWKLLVCGCGQSWDPPEQLWSFSASFRPAVDAAEPPSSDPGTPLPAVCDFCHPPPPSHCPGAKPYRPMRAFFLSVSASFSTTFCFCAAISSFVFSLSLVRQKGQLQTSSLECGQPHLQDEFLLGPRSSRSQTTRLNVFWATANEEITEIK